MSEAIAVSPLNKTGKKSGNEKKTYLLLQNGIMTYIIIRFRDYTSGLWRYAS